MVRARVQQILFICCAFFVVYCVCYFEGGKRMDIKQLSLNIIAWGIKEEIQDVYILPRGDRIQVSARKGRKRLIFKELSDEEGEKLIFHFKFIGSMDVGEKRQAQVGAVTYRINDEDQRLRLSTVGDFRQRESLVIRFLHAFGNSQENYFLPQQLRKVRERVKYRGLHLFCGPVGSGKTTLMYKLAKETDRFQQVITIEDPVEIEEKAFLQLQTNAKINLTYDVLIKACLRHRPDILIIGEIRDALTAQAAIRAALTGHTVFATLHARSIGGVYERLLELGIQPREIAECITGIIYQRLLPCKSIFYEEQNGLLMDCNFSKTTDSDWLNKLRKVWAYGFIDDRTFEQEKEQ
jgi:competence protein ComGA